MASLDNVRILTRVVGPCVGVGVEIVGRVVWCNISGKIPAFVKDVWVVWALFVPRASKGAHPIVVYGCNTVVVGLPRHALGGGHEDIEVFVVLLFGFLEHGHDDPLADAFAFHLVNGGLVKGLSVNFGKRVLELFLEGLLHLFL